ncbi:NlpC/P60 family protein [Rhodanobacter glycinis]|uniref:NlpC/P60 family protein n=1 Tax=Rhodanobacter glycinis TaxID=582702 RepID=A0A5B9DVV8_9GAMM|nr:C40 family peptidase [Rhodanobacter glycinis]QEE24033.1 NlpC/P60 family protein [Rhodanobacter glycinis]
MLFKRLTASAVLVSALLASGTLFAAGTVGATADMAAARASAPLMDALPIFNPATKLAQSMVPSGPVALPASAADDQALDLRKTLISLAMKLRNSPYVRGGHSPSTGFDCSGFVRYVFAHALGLELPTNSASQFHVGHKVKRDQMKPGDLVFFRTAGRHGHGRVSHVGIYLSGGRFIHSPRHGETVRVDSLQEAYWAKRFAGAKRPDAMAEIDSMAARQG